MKSDERDRNTTFDEYFCLFSPLVSQFIFMSDRLLLDSFWTLPLSDSILMTIGYEEYQQRDAEAAGDELEVFDEIHELLQ